ncbi:MAG: SCP2 sterol-binding domain-containing protein [Pseudomonadota bacterium]
MARYLTPLPGWLARSIQHVINRAVALDEMGTDQLKPLRERWLKFELSGMEIDLWFGADENGMIVDAEQHEEDVPDTIIHGTPGALIGMAIPEMEGPSQIRIEGDARLAQQFQQLLKNLDPDWEAGISNYLGDLIGPQVYRMLVEAGRFGQHAVKTSGEQISHWLRDESGSVPNQEEWADWRDQVDDLREAVDRFESRVRRRAKQQQADA